MLQTNATFHSKPKFHFEVFWPKFDDFLEAMTRGCTCDENVTNGFRRLDCLIRNVTRELQSWSEKKIGSVKLQLLIAKELILKLDQAHEFRVISAAELDLCKQLKQVSLGLASLERTIARQRSRVHYL